MSPRGARWAGEGRGRPGGLGLTALGTGLLLLLPGARWRVDVAARAALGPSVAPAQGPAWWRQRSPLPWGLPMRCPHLLVSARFHDPRYRRQTGRVHDGIDLVCPRGTPVRATLAGTVVLAGWLWPLGETVWVQAGATRVLYGHLLSRLPVRTGQPVRPGTLLGWEGATGLCSGPHLHYQVERHEPLAVVPPPADDPADAVNPLPTLGQALPDVY